MVICFSLHVSAFDYNLLHCEKPQYTDPHSVNPVDINDMD